MKKSQNDQIVRLYFSDDGPVMAGFLIAVTTNENDANKPSFEEGRILDEYYYEPIRITKKANEHVGDSDMIWLVLEGWYSDISRWEDFEPGGIGAALSKKEAERIESAHPPAGEYTVIGIRNGWRYGHDPIPEITYPAEMFDD